MENEVTYGVPQENNKGEAVQGWLNWGLDSFLQLWQSGAIGKNNPNRYAQPPIIQPQSPNPQIIIGAGVLLVVLIVALLVIKKA